MKPAFYNISEEKKRRIFQACINEFSSDNYDNCSLNNIVKKAGISKGGLFKYISNKEELYLYTLEQAMTELIIYQSQHVTKASTCYFDRIMDLTNIAMEYYMTNNNSYKVILMGLLDRQSSVYGPLIDLRNRLVESHKIDLLEGIDWGQYRIGLDQLKFVVECTMNGYNIELLEHMSGNITVEEFKVKMNKELGMLLSVLKEGVL